MINALYFGLAAIFIGGVVVFMVTEMDEWR